MFERFTERSRQVVALAQEEARILENDYLGTEHILLGLLREEEGLGARVLGSPDIGVERVRARVIRIVGRGDEVTWCQPMTSSAQRVLQRALREALSLGHDHIGTEHILLGLMDENDGVAARVLLESGADREKIHATVTGMLWSPGTLEEPEEGDLRESRGPSGERDLGQRRQALRRANAVRLARARLKRDLRHGKVQLAEVVREPPPGLLTAKVFDFALASPRIGRVKAARLFERARISQSKTFGGLSERQRSELLSVLDGPSPGRAATP